MCPRYTLRKTAEDRFRLDSHDGADARPIALVLQVIDRSGAPAGWRLKPLVVMRGSPSRIWPSPADALASTKLMKASEAKAVVARAELAL